MSETTIEPLTRMSKDLAVAARTLTHTEARYLVDAYYQMQDDRIRAGNQVRATSDGDEPHEVLRWLFDSSSLLEQQVARALDKYTDAHVVGKWSRSIVGIGPIIAAGLLAHISMEPWTCVAGKVAEIVDVDDMPDVIRNANIIDVDDETPPVAAPVAKCTRKAPCSSACGPKPLNTVGKLWRFAGLDPTVTWSKGQRRPWNASLKTLCWKAGESFVKQSAHEEDVYGKLYIQRKQIELRHNLAGDYTDAAIAALLRRRFGNDTDARVWYEGRLTADAATKYYATPSERRMGLAKKLAGDVGSGVAMLPPAHIHARSKRWAVKIFLAHWHAVAHRAHFGTDAPKPYVMAILGHVDEIQCPNWPFKKESPSTGENR
jgi:hypothetical protein